ncbi:MAG: CHAT domain-containing protein [Cyanobacteria bacterium J06649_4]
MTDKQIENQVQSFSEILQLIAKHKGNPLKIYMVWAKQRAFFNADLLNKMPVLTEQLFERNADQLPFIAALLGAFGDLIQQFPLGQPWVNLELSIVAYEQALTIRTKSDPIQWAATTNNLAMAYRDLIKGNRADNLELALNACQQVLTVRTKSGMPVDWAQTTSNLASVYLYRIRGERAKNLEQAINNYQRALTVITKETRAVDWAQIMNDLGNAYLYRIRGDQTENIEQAIYNYQQALTVRTRFKLPVERSQTLVNQGSAYLKRVRGNKAENIEQAIKAYKQALKVLTKRKRPVDWASAINELGNAYLSRIQGSQQKNIEQAISCYQKSLSVMTQKEMPVEWAESIMNLASAYLKRIQGAQAENIERAIDYYQQALTVRTRTAMPVAWATTMGNLALTYYDRIRGKRTDNIKRTVDYYQQALTVFTPEQLPQSCRKTAQNLAILHSEEQNWTEAAATYKIALQAAERLYQSALLPDSKKITLSEIADLHRRAAYAFSQIQDFSQAVETIEKGRARGLSESLDKDRTNLFKLKENHPALYNQYIALIEKLRTSDNQQREQSLSNDRNSITPEDTRKRALLLSQELNALIQDIRQVPGYGNFLDLLTFEDVQQLAHENCPLTYLISTPEGSLTLIVTPKNIQPIWLNDFTEVRLVSLLKETWFSAYGQTLKDNQDWLEAINSVTCQLWELLMQPVISHLKAHNFNQSILIPTGYLSFLPLHAIWTEDENRPTKRRYALDDIHFTYSPNAKSLTAARTIAHRLQPDSILAIDNPSNDLPNSEREVNVAISGFRDYILLRHHEATVAAVKAQLAEAVIAHFSCHGTASLTEPLNSGLLMHDGELTLKDIFSLNLAENAGLRLAVLSACETGIIGIENADEAISLPTGLLQAGVAAVISSLWSVDDRSTMMLLTRFYDLWRTEGLEISQALRQAQQWLRDTTNGEKATYFKDFMPTQSTARMPASVADHLYKALILSDPNARDLSHPFHWAAFTYVGV